MGKIKQGILGGFSGKVGNVIGSSWNGIAYMRRMPTSFNDPKTLKQKMQRGKFTAVLSALQPVTAFLRVGFKTYAQGRSAFNAAMSHTFKHAITGEYPNYTIDYAKLHVSLGNLTGAGVATTSVLDGKIELFWNNNSGTGNAQATDKALVVAINPTKGESTYITDGATRASGREELPMPPSWQGDEIKVYLSFISEDGKDVATSVYCGAVKVLKTTTIHNIKKKEDADNPIIRKPLQIIACSGVRHSSSIGKQDIKLVLPPATEVAAHNKIRCIPEKTEMLLYRQSLFQGFRG